MKYIGPDKKEYKSKKEYCEQAGITIGMLYYRTKKDWTQEQISCGKYKVKHKATSNRGKPITDLEGNTYRSKSEFCKKYKINRTTLAKREKRNWTMEEIINGKREKKEKSGK